MRPVMVAAIFTLAVVLPVRGQTPQAQVSAEDCLALWKIHDDDEDDMLSGKELERLKSSMAAIDTNNDGKVTREEFVTACQKGLLKDVKK